MMLIFLHPIEFHKKHGKLATVTSVFPPGRFGALEIEGSSVKSFMEKPKGDGGMINGGFFVLSPKVLTKLRSLIVFGSRSRLNLWPMTVS